MTSKQENIPTVGKLIVITGPMFSGKSGELQRQVRRLRLAGKKCLIVKHAWDTRYGKPNECCTHDQQTMPALSTRCLFPIIGNCSEFDVIGIDEGQFFTDIVEFVDEIVENRGKIVIVAALDSTFEGKPFGRVSELVCRSESFVKLTAICQDCGNEASFSVRRVDFVGERKVIEVIGAADIYESVCRGCRAKRGI